MLPTFDDSWYRVAKLQLRLRPGVDVRRQFFRGEKWYVVEDPFANQFYRMRPAAYRFVARLQNDRTVDDVWEESLAADGDDAPGQGEVIHLLGQLYHANLLQANLPGDSERLFARQKDRKQRELIGKLTSLLFIRIPLWNPDAFLKATLSAVRWLMSWVGAVLWFAAAFFALKLLADNWQEFKDQSQSILSVRNLGWLYVGAVITKVLHEFGHSYVCRHYGGQVTIMGVMLLVFTPLPYMDASSSWSFTRRKQRIHVGAAGMIVEMFVAALAMIVWAYSGEGVVHNVAYNMVFIASVATFLFNINPLLRFDGYYILSDLLDYPNLHQNSSSQVGYWINRYLFGVQTATPPTRKKREAAWLTFVFIASFIYKTLLFVGIILFVADRFLIVGLIFAIIGAISWLLIPTIKAVNNVATAPKFQPVRRRAMFCTIGIPLLLLGLLAVIPFPHYTKAEGVVRAAEYSDIYTRVDGRLAEILVPSGQQVKAGQALVRLANTELQLAQVGEISRRSESVVRRGVVEENGELGQLTYLDKWSAAVNMRLNDMQRQIGELTVYAPHDGLWIAPNLHELSDVWLPRGLALGRVVNEEDYNFSAVISQSRTHHLFEQQVDQSAPGKNSVRLRGQAGEEIPVQGLQIIPADVRYLSSTALGMLGGGDVELAENDRTGRRTKEPVFEVRAALADVSGVVFQHDASGKIRMKLQNEPLLKQWIRKVRQLMQKRYRL